MNAKIEQTPENLNPVLSVSKDGTVFYSNEASEPLLNEWGVRVGEKLPSNIVDLVKRVISRNNPEKIEVNIGSKPYLVIFSPIPEQECVNISGFDIGKSKVLEERLYENKTREINLELADIVDVQAIQSLLDDFYKFAHITIAIVDLKGNILVSVGWQDICTKFHRVHPMTCRFCVESDTKLSAGVPIGEFKLYKCKNNMWDIATPIIVGGMHLGNIFSGQFFFDDEPLDYELFRSQARLYGFNEEEYMTALEKVPRMSREAVETSMSFFMKFANMISQLSFSNIKLAQLLADRDTLVEELRVSEERLHRMSRAGHIGLYEWNTDRDMVYFSPKAYELYGCDPNSLVTHENWLKRIHPDDRKMVEHNIAKAHDNARNRHDNSSRYEFRVVHADGTVLWLEAESTYYFECGDLIARGVVRDITEKKRTEKALKESEQKYRRIVETAQEGIWLIDQNDRTVFVNQKMSDMLGFSIKEILGQSPQKFMAPEFRITAEDRLIEHMQGTIQVIDYRFIRKDGSNLWCILSSSPLFDNQGKYSGSLAMITDITERKKVEEALKEAYENLEIKIQERTIELEKAYTSLKESEGRLAEAQRIAHIGNWDNDLVKGELYWSSEMYRIFGLKPQKGITYEQFLNYIHPDDRDYVFNSIEDAFKGKVYPINHRIIRPDGEERIVHSERDVIFNEKNKPIRIRGTAQDITEHKKAEEKIQMLAEVVESSNDAIATSTLEGITTSWNEGAEQMHGYSADEIIGKNLTILEPDDHKGELFRLAEKVKHGDQIKDYETVKLKKDGTRINVSVTLSPVFDSSGKLTAFSIIARDITDRIKAEETLAKTEEARIKEIHHRIKNNLQIINSLLDLQAEKFEGRDVLEAFRESQNRVISMSLIHEELYKGNGLDTLDFSAYIKKLTENLFQTYDTGSKNIRLFMNLEENACFNMDIAIPLGIIVNELVSNSLKHAFLGIKEGEIRVVLLKDEHNNNFILSISDNGVGIPEDLDIENLDSLGLQLVTTLVEQLDGKLELNSDNGTEFTIRFTVTEKENQESETAPKFIE